jgi:hypothetical protein
MTSLSGTICNFDIEASDINIVVSKLRYQRTPILIDNLNERECKGERAAAARQTRTGGKGERAWAAAAVAVRARTARSRYIYQRGQRVKVAR